MAYHVDHVALSAAPAADHCAALFRESFGDMAERWTLGLAWALAPKRISGLPNLARLCFHELLAPDYALPDPERALANPPGLAGIVHDLSLPTLLAAYRRGLYPLAHVAPLKWWSPPQRSVLLFKNFHMSNNLRRLMRQGRYSVTFDRDFDAVIAACAARRQGRGTSPGSRRASCAPTLRLTMPARRIPSKSGTRPALVAGGYGVAIGASFTAESQFTHESNASRIGVSVLNWHLANWGYRLNDGKLIGPLGKHGLPRHAAARVSGAAVGCRASAGARARAGRSRPTWRPSRAGSRNNPVCFLPAVIDHVSHQRDFRNPAANTRMAVFILTGLRGSFGDGTRRHRMIGIGRRHDWRRDCGRWR